MPCSWSHRSTLWERVNQSNRRIPPLLSLILVALVLLSPSGATQKKKPPKPAAPGWRQAPKIPSTPNVMCRRCNGRGWVWCHRHKKGFIKLEEGIPSSSAGSGCKSCKGMLRLDCSACTNAAAEAWLRSAHAKRRQWIAERRKYDKVVGHTLLHLASPHFDLLFDVPKLKVGRRLVKRHPLAHLYLDRLEAHYRHFKKVLHCTDGDFKPPFMVCIWDVPVDQAKVSPMITGMGSRGGHGSKLMGRRVAFTVSRHRGVDKDEDLHRCVIHNVTHLLLSNIEPHEWIGKRKAGWLDAGVAHYFEFLHDGLCRNFCFTEQNNMVDFKGGKWRAWIRRQVAMGGSNLPKFVAYYRKLIDELTPLEHALSFSVVEFLMTRHGGEKLRDLVRGIMRKQDQRELIKQIYGYTPIKMEEEWRAHVLATYPTRE